MITADQHPAAAAGACNVLAEQKERVMICLQCESQVSRHALKLV